jgi:hypothetical protein
MATTRPTPNGPPGRAPDGNAIPIALSLRVKPELPPPSAPSGPPWPAVVLEPPGGPVELEPRTGAVRGAGEPSGVGVAGDGLGIETEGIGRLEVLGGEGTGCRPPGRAGIGIGRPGRGTGAGIVCGAAGVRVPAAEADPDNPIARPTITTERGPNRRITCPSAATPLTHSL